MIDDQPFSMNRVIAIEATMDEMKSQHRATHQMLQDVLTRLGAVPTRDVQNSLPTHSAHYSPAPFIPASSAGRKKVSLKPSFPPEFSGDQASGKAFLTSCRTYIRLCPKAFLTSCRTYIRLCPKAFEDDSTKIVWAMSYMKSGCANRWATRKFEQEAKTGHLRFLDWLDFEDKF